MTPTALYLPDDLWNAIRAEAEAEEMPVGTWLYLAVRGERKLKMRGRSDWSTKARRNVSIPDVTLAEIERVTIANAHPGRAQALAQILGL